MTNHTNQEGDCPILLTYSMSVSGIVLVLLWIYACIIYIWDECRNVKELMICVFFS